MLPNKNKTATTDNTNGQILIGRTEVLKPITKVHKPKTIVMMADMRYTSADTE